MPPSWKTGKKRIKNKKHERRKLIFFKSTRPLSVLIVHLFTTKFSSAADQFYSKSSNIYSSNLFTPDNRSIFLPHQIATSHLKYSRQKRSDRLKNNENQESTLPSNRERECIEEFCDSNEILKIFSDDKNDAKIFQKAYKPCQKLKKSRAKRKKLTRRDKSNLRACIKDKYSNGFLSTNPCDYESSCDKVGTKKCTPTGGNTFICGCRTGYFGKSCDLNKNGDDENNSSQKSKFEITKFDHKFNLETKQQFNQNNRFEEMEQNCKTNADCRNIGKCRRNGKCNCKGTGFTGPSCNIDQDECLTGEHQCGLDIHCVNTVGSYKCKCGNGYEMNNAGSCVDINECNQIGRCDAMFGRCINTPGSFSCKCTKTGFDVVRVNEGKFVCEDVDECGNENGGCDQMCMNTQGSYACNCEDGYDLSEIDDHTCIDIDECQVDNGGCKNRCVNLEGGFKCGCEIGFQLSADGVSCVDIDECNQIQSVDFESDQLCDFDKTCENTIGSFTCNCKPGFIQSIKGICKASDVCGSGFHRCASPATCEPSSPGKYTCNCPAGFKLSGKYRCQDINECFQQENLCENGYCKNLKPGFKCDCFELYGGEFCDTCKCVFGTCPSDQMSKTCDCRKGYQGTFCEEDINECEENNGGCSHECFNKVGSFVCKCPEGYELGKDYSTCEDVDECEVMSNSCPNGNKCVNIPGGFNCLCPAGFEELNSGLCKDIDECESETHNCEFQCINLEPGFECGCQPGFELNPVSKICEDINECSNDPCNKPGTRRCKNTDGSYTCKCKRNYTGNHCETSVCPTGYTGDDCTVDLDECEITGICKKFHGCKNSVGSYECYCNTGFLLKPNQCVDIDECLPELDICQTSGTCNNFEGGFECECHNGYESKNHSSLLIGNECVDIDECLDEDEKNQACSELQECRNTAGAWKCKICDPDRESIFVDKHGRRKCRRNKCLKEPCDSFGGVCVDDDTRKGYSCRCKPGFHGDACELDIDECVENAIVCPGELRCRNTLGSFRCEFDETRVIDTVHNPVIDEPTFDDMNESNENLDTAGKIVSIFQPAPVSRGSDYCETLNKKLKVGPSCEIEAETCREHPCTIGCEDVPGHCPCLFEIYEFNVLECTILGSALLLIFILVWVMLICCIARCVNRHTERVQDKYNHTRHNHHQLSYDDFHLQR